MSDVAADMSGVSIQCPNLWVRLCALPNPPFNCRQSRIRGDAVLSATVTNDEAIIENLRRAFLVLLGGRLPTSPLVSHWVTLYVFPNPPFNRRQSRRVNNSTCVAIVWKVYFLPGIGISRGPGWAKKVLQNSKTKNGIM